MNNDKYARYSKGPVTYGSNGAYTKSYPTSDKKSSGCLPMVVGILIAAASLFYGVNSVQAMDDSGLLRSESCRTYPLFAHQKDGDMTHENDYDLCGNSASVAPVVTVDTESSHKARDERESTVETVTPAESPVIVHVVNDDSPIVPDETVTPEEPKEDNSPAENDDKPKGNNGHGNNDDGVDSSNPGNGPKNDENADPSCPVDDEKKKGKG